MPSPDPAPPADRWGPGPRVGGAGGVAVATWDGGGDGEALVLLHGTGFTAGVWRPLAARLAAHHRVWAVDQRGHGASGHAPGGDYRDWGALVDDLFAVLDTVARDGPVVGAGHSLGGAVLLMAEQRRPGTFRRLYCYEPIVIPPAWRSRQGSGPDLAEVARRRRSRFASRAEALANFAAKPPFAAWDPAVLAGYVDGGLVDDPRGGVRLACAPDEEATFYEGALLADAWERLGEVGCPVTVAAGRPGHAPAAFAAEVTAALPDAALVRHGDLDHFGPMVAPERIAGEVVTALGGGRVTDPVTPGR